MALNQTSRKPIPCLNPSVATRSDQSTQPAGEYFSLNPRSPEKRYIGNRISICSVHGTAGYSGIQTYSWLHVTVGYSDTARYSRIQQDTAGYSGIQRDAAGYSGIQRDTAGYCGIQRDAVGYSRIKRDTARSDDQPRDRRSTSLMIK
jgi:hypothetical protein